MNTKTDAANAASSRKPWLSLFFATAGGAGYLPAVPGTWGSLVGVLLYWITCRLLGDRLSLDPQKTYYLIHHFPAGVSFRDTYHVIFFSSFIEGAIAAAVAIIGVVAATRVSRFTGKKDPQIVVIDEVSGQFLTYFLALAPLNWKYLLLGLILFRGFDVWKPFPARQAEALPGGWGIMADDWIAGIYAALGIWIARALGL